MKQPNYKTKYTYYSGENAKFCWNESKKLLRKYKSWENISDDELRRILNGIELCTVDANAHGGSVEITWNSPSVEECNEEADMYLEVCDDDWIKLFLNVIPRLKKLLNDKTKSKDD